MVDRIARCDPGLVRQAARRASGGGDAVPYVPSDLHRARTREPESSPRPIFLVAGRLVQTWSSNEREFAELRSLAVEGGSDSCLPGLSGLQSLARPRLPRAFGDVAPEASRPVACQPPRSLGTDGRTRCGTRPAGGAPVSLDLGSSRGLAYSRFAAALHAILVRLASRSPAPILPPLPQGKGSASEDRPDPDRSWSWRCRQWKLHLLSPHLPMPPYEVDRGRENRAQPTTDPAGPAVLLPPHTSRSSSRQR